MNRILRAAACWLAVTAPWAAQAAPVGLFNTGLDNSGAALASGASDTHYRVLNAAFAATPVVKTAADGNPIAPGGWLLDSPQSAWLSPAGAWFFTDQPGITDQITYETSFDLTGYDTQGVIEGRWAADDSGLAIRISGQAVPGLAVAQYDQWTTFTIRTGFLAGRNTLQFDTLSTQSPTGLRVEFLRTDFQAQVPEPGSAALLALGLVALTVARRAKALQA